MLVYNLFTIAILNNLEFVFLTFKINSQNETIKYKMILIIYYNVDLQDFSR